jgi:hypothetical protein
VQIVVPAQHEFFFFFVRGGRRQQARESFADQQREGL